jgi:prepilin-type N-terminal cleavage/methylation domain-containing protein/prepilin-type processing-associated H-X9-DG protein
MSSTAPARRAFALIELLTVIAIMGVLAALVLPAIGACRAQARKSREISAARHLLVAYHLAADENRGRLLPLQEAASGTVNERGKTVSGIAAFRWPHRLRPYLGDRFRATLYVNEQADFYDEKTADDYSLSIAPSFGLNGVFVGGDFSALVKDHPVRRLAEAASPARLVAFASTHYRDLHPKAGYWRSSAPCFGWPAEDPAGLPASPAQDAAYGHLAPRWGGRAVVALLDGHVELRALSELRDMRLWSDLARRADDPGYAPAQ